MRWGARFVKALAILIIFTGIGRAAVGIGWPEAVGRLAAERSKAEMCVGLLKGHGTNEEVARGRLAYGMAKADFDAVIAELTTALAEGAKPKSLPSLEASLQRGASGLVTLCTTVDGLLPATSGQKSWLGDALKEGIEQLIKPLLEAVSTIYNDFQKEKAMVRATIQTQLEAARWPEFAEVKAVQ
jgi:hypothetical protein